MVFRALFFQQREFEVVETEDFVYLVGGVLDGNDVANIEIFDKKANTWETKFLQSPRTDPTVIFHENKLIVHGGFNDFSREVEIFDLSTEQSSIVKLDINNTDAKIFASNDKLVIAGDFSGDARVVDLNTLDFEVYQLEDTPRLRNLQGGVIGDKVVLAGGSAEFNRLYIYNSRWNVWEKADLSRGREFVSFINQGDKLYMAGGRYADRTLSEEVLIFGDFPVSVKESNTHLIEVFPNPTKNYLEVDNLSVVYGKYFVSSMNGKIVQKGNVSDENIDISSLKSGVYIISFISQNFGQTSRRFVKL